MVLTERNVFGSLFRKAQQLSFRQGKRRIGESSLWGKRNELAVNLSYGQRKLLEIARAVSTQAEMYLLDEPFAGLFPEITKNSFRNYSGTKREGKTVVLIEHNKELIHELCFDNVIVMDSGRLFGTKADRKSLKKKEVIGGVFGRLEKGRSQVLISNKLQIPNYKQIHKYKPKSLKSF